MAGILFEPTQDFGIAARQGFLAAAGLVQCAQDPGAAATLSLALCDTSGQ